MTTIPAEGLRAGAHNLLVGCAGLSGGESLAIVHEDPELGWYDRIAPDAVAGLARDMDMRVTMLQVDAPDEAETSTAAVEAALTGHDQTIYFARLGDQDRFGPQRTARPPVMSYVVDGAGLASPFGRFPHSAFLELKAVVDALMQQAGEIAVRCPAGTDLRGSSAGMAPDGPEDVSVRRFPMGVYRPIPMKGFRGRVALARWLVPTGSRPYRPAVLPLAGTVHATVEHGTIAGFSGPERDVRAVERHHRHVAGLFGIEPMATHSWHSGIHPCCRFAGRAAGDPDRWANTVFMNPRVLHVHTCGDYAPGEICWMVIDPVIELDGRTLWDRGRMNTGFSPALSEIVGRWPGLDRLLADPDRTIGLD